MEHLCLECGWHLADCGDKDCKVPELIVCLDCCSSLQEPLGKLQNRSEFQTIKLVSYKPILRIGF